MGIEELKGSFNALQNLYMQKYKKNANADELINYAKSQNQNIVEIWDTLLDGNDKKKDNINLTNYYADGQNLLFQSDNGEITAFNLNDGSVRVATTQDLTTMLDALDDNITNGSITDQMTENGHLQLGRDNIDSFESTNLRNANIKTSDNTNSTITISSEDVQQLLTDMTESLNCVNIQELITKLQQEPNLAAQPMLMVSDYLKTKFGNGDMRTTLAKLTDAANLPNDEAVINQAYEEAVKNVYNNLIGAFTDNSKKNNGTDFILSDINKADSDFQSIKQTLDKQFAIEEEQRKYEKSILHRNGDNRYGKIDWNNDGRFNNEGNGWNDGFIARHGHLDQFYTYFGKTWTTDELEQIVNSMDNSAKDKDARAGFVSNGTITAHKISDTQIGFNITGHDMSRGAGFNYNYVVWDKAENKFIVGNDTNGDGNLTLSDKEVIAYVHNAGKKTSSPLTFDLNGDGVRTSANEINYDIDGDGDLDRINDADDGVLTIRGGKDGRDVFGNNTDLDGDGKADGFKNGFEALKALAKKEGLINGTNDMILDKQDLEILKEKYDLAMKMGYNSENKDLSEIGISSISLGSSDDVALQSNFDGRDNDIMTQQGALFTINGEQRDYADVWHKHLNKD